MASEGQLRMGVSCCGRTSLSLNFLICKMATGMGQGSGSGTGCLEQPLALSFGGHWTPAGHLCVYGRNAGNNSTCHPGLLWEPVRNRHKAPRRARHRACPRPTMAATPDGVKGMPGTPHPGGGSDGKGRGRLGPTWWEMPEATKAAKGGRPIPVTHSRFLSSSTEQLLRKKENMLCIL